MTALSLQAGYPSRPAPGAAETAPIAIVKTNNAATRLIFGSPEMPHYPVTYRFAQKRQAHVRQFESLRRGWLAENI